MASRVARAASRKVGTNCEVLFVRAVRRMGLRPRLNVETLPGKPDLAFPRAKVVVFCDGDFWHGRDFARRKRRLIRGHNAPYWVAKIATNCSRSDTGKRSRQMNVPSNAGAVVSTGGNSHKSKEQLRGEGKLCASDGPNRADAIEFGLHDRIQVSLDNVAFIIRLKASRDRPKTPQGCRPLSRRSQRACLARPRDD
ncbi:MAG: hypothetical protein ACT4TC_12470 [Myxococcaceae bacterium]